MFKVGITGTIGSGKTTVTRIFETLGIPVYYADLESKRLMDFPLVTQKVVAAFGEELLTSQGHIDRHKLASVVFSDPEKLNRLNAIMHPLVKEDFECWQGLHHDAPYILQEAAILLESGLAPYFNRLIVVSAPEQLRIQRVMDRDRVQAEQVRQRAERQWPDEEKCKYADYVILNDNKQLVIPRVMEVHREILKLL